MDPKLTAEIVKTCESIGFADEGEKYIADPQWELCVKDLILYLRRDDDDHSVRRLLGETAVLGRDLLPLLKVNSKDPKTWEVTLRLLVNLTHPALLLYDEEIPKNKTYLNYYHQLESYLRTYKAAFVDKGVWKTLADKLRELLDLDWEKRKELDRLTIERIFILIRNILYIPADPAEERRADDDTSLHDRILMVMHLSGIFDILLHVAAAAGSSHEYSILVLEIMSWMLREQTGEQLAKTSWTRNEEDKIKDEQELMRVREKEAVLKSATLHRVAPRHSRFGGTFVVRDVKAPSGRDIITHKPISSVADIDLDVLKKRKKVPSNRKPIGDVEMTRRSTTPIRIILKNFCASFMDGKYNLLMSTVRDYINRSRDGDNDETYYLWALKFFMEFNRHHEFSVSKVSDTVTSNTFHYVQTLIDKYQGMMVTDKEKIPLWSKRSHTALKAYQELLFTLLWIDKHETNERAKDQASSIKNNVFYLPEYRELCFSLLNTYDPVKLSKAYLKDLIETNHLFLKMLEDYSKNNRKIVVRCKGKKRPKKRSKKNAPPRKRAKLMSTEELNDGWTNISEQVKSAVESFTGVPEEEVSNTSENVIPFDAASDVEIDEQKEIAVERIAAFLHTNKFKEAVILLRAAREVWPTDEEYFGAVGSSSEAEVELLQSIYVDQSACRRVLEARSDMLNVEATTATNERVNEPGVEVEASSAAPPPPETDPEPVVDQEEELERAAVIGDENDAEDEEDEDEEEEEENQRVQEVEQEFDFKGFVLKYAQARVVCNYALLFQDWDTLKPLTMHCILKMFHRFVFDMGYPALICQASLFLTFKKILAVADYRSDLKDVKAFFVHFWPKFIKLCEDKKMFIEILFWKTAREAQEIQDGYADLRGDGGTKAKKSDWTKDEDGELGLLVELYHDSPEEVKRAQKLLDFIMERWTWRSRSKQAFKKRLLERELARPEDLAGKRKGAGTGRKRGRKNRSANSSDDEGGRSKTPELPDVSSSSDSETEDAVARNRNKTPELPDVSSDSEKEEGSGRTKNKTPELPAVSSDSDDEETRPRVRSKTSKLAGVSSDSEGEETIARNKTKTPEVPGAGSDSEKENDAARSRNKTPELPEVSSDSDEEDNIARNRNKTPELPDVSSDSEAEDSAPRNGNKTPELPDVSSDDSEAESTIRRSKNKSRKVLGIDSDSDSDGEEDSAKVKTKTPGPVMDASSDSEPELEVPVVRKKRLSRVKQMLDSDSEDEDVSANRLTGAETNGSGDVGTASD